MSTPIFISYSHKDEEWKDRVVTHLRVLQMQDMIDVWDDRRIGAGDDWRAEIETALDAASIAVLLITANFLTSIFILDEEVPKLLERRAKQGVRVIPLIVKPCVWTQVKWLSPIQARPKDGRALSAGNENQIDTDLAALANEIAAIVRRVGAIHESPLRAPLPPDKISLAKLPSTSPDLFGREKELALLDAAWNPQPPSNSPRFAGGESQPLPPLSQMVEDPRSAAEGREGWGGGKVNVLSLVAWGGVGKSALVNKWLAQMARDNYRGAERVFGWSFYSQGAAEGRQVSADQFIATALAWFGDPDPNLGSPWDKGERLAELVKQSRALIILDGLEPLQNPPPVETGRIKDPALVAFLRELAVQNPGLVVITTRLAVEDLHGFTRQPLPHPPLQGREGVGSVVEIDLDNLSPEAGAAYLSHLGVDGTDAERQDAATDFGGHALALTLLGSYLKRVHHGDIRKHHEIPHLTDDQKQGAHARRVLESYQRWLKGKPELDILRLMGLFDRPAERGALDALRKEPTIKGLTDALQKLTDADWQFAVANLRDLRLLAAPDVDDADRLDCHPLLREHFGEQLKQANPAAWREGNNRLYEYYKSTAKELPDTIQEMAPLYAAVMHGCQSGKYQEALDEVYWRRISRGEEYFATKKLGAFGTDLAALSGFFDGTSWRKPVDELREDYKGFVLAQAGFRLRALSRLAEAAQPIQTGLEGYIARQDWENASIQASNLSELYLTIGDVTQALTYAEQGVELADRSGDAFRRLHTRARLADALHQSEKLAEAQAAFLEAEEMQKKFRLEFPILLSVSGFQYCDMLLDQGNYAEVQHRANQALDCYKHFRDIGLHDFALDSLSLGRAHLLQSQREPNHPITESANFLNRAVDGLRQAGIQEFLTRGLLARTEFYRVTGVLEKAKRDLDEAFAIATRGGMGLYLADCHLEYARLALAQGRGAIQLRPYDDAREHLAIAKEMIEKMGYHRRDKDVEELEREMLDHESRETLRA